jgi:hypothetical protein
MYISKTILIIIIFIISILASQKILETFVFLDVNSLDKVLINPNITKYSIILPNNMHKMKRVDALKNNLCKNNELMINMIKYSEGTEWSKWLTCDDKTISEYAKKIYYYINNKIKQRIIYYNVEKYRYCINKKYNILFDTEYVLYKNNAASADHIKILCVVDTNTNKIHILYVDIIGIINEDKLYIRNEYKDSIYEDVNLNNVRNGIQIECEDSCSALLRQDNDVVDLLYSKLANDTANNDPLYLENEEYKNIQSFVKNVLFEGHMTNIKTNNIYKNYPYTNDFNIVS